jgi:hypothetical protein
MVQRRDIARITICTGGLPFASDQLLYAQDHNEQHIAYGISGGLGENTGGIAPCTLFPPISVNLFGKSLACQSAHNLSSHVWCR